MQNKFSQNRIVAFACLSPVAWSTVSLSRCPTVAALAPCQSSRSGVAVPTASGQQQQQQQQQEKQQHQMARQQQHEFYTCLASHSFVSASPHPRLPTARSHWWVQRVKKAASSVFDFEILTLDTKIIGSQFYMLEISIYCICTIYCITYIFI